MALRASESLDERPPIRFKLIPSMPGFLLLVVSLSLLVVMLTLRQYALLATSWIFLSIACFGLVHLLINSDTIWTGSIVFLVVDAGIAAALLFRYPEMPEATRELLISFLLLTVGLSQILETVIHTKSGSVWFSLSGIISSVGALLLWTGMIPGPAEGLGLVTAAASLGYSISWLTNAGKPRYLLWKLHSNRKGV